MDMALLKDGMGSETQTQNEKGKRKTSFGTIIRRLEERPIGKQRAWGHGATFTTVLSRFLQLTASS